jgi:hypothetical protein
MSEHEALARFHYGCAARHHKVEIRRLWRSRCMMHAQRSPLTNILIRIRLLRRSRIYTSLRHRPLAYVWSRRFEMPRASWRGFLRLSLVSCPVYLSPATTRTKPIRLHQVWQPAPVDVDEDDLPDLGGSAPSVTRLRADNAGADGDESPAATRITLRPHDPLTSSAPRQPQTR